MSFDSEFNKHFGNLLVAYGFVKLRGTHCFAKLVNDEVLQYLTYCKVSSPVKGKKAFSMLAGIETIYSKSLSKRHLQYAAMDYKSFRWIDPAIIEKGSYWNVYVYDDNSIIDALNEAANETIHVAFRYMERVVDIASYVDYCKFMCPVRLSFADRLNHDSLLLIKIHSHDSFLDVYKKKIRDAMIEFSFVDENSPAFIAFKQNTYIEIQEGIVKPRDRVYSSPDLTRMVAEELERRKTENIGMLASYGILVK